MTTKRTLIDLLAPYLNDEPVVFVTFDDGIVVHEEIEVVKGHATTRRGADGRIEMPVAVYLVDDGQQGRATLPKGVALPDLRPGPPVSTLDAARALLLARQDQMLTIAEWVTLARAVAIATDVRTIDLLADADHGRIAEAGVEWNDDADGPLTPRD